MDREPRVGEVVVYRPDRASPKFHDHGTEPELPAVVVKVWPFPEGDTSVNLRVCPNLDLKVMLNSADNFPFVFGIIYSKERKVDSWRFVEDA